MEPQALLDALCELARDAGLAVKRLGAAGTEGLPASGGVCRVRGEVWVLLGDGDPVEERIELLARALRDHAGPALEDRYLPPAVRERLERDSPGD